MCTDDPTPAEPKLMVSGCLRASATSCFRSLAGSAGWATTTCGISASTVTTFRSVAGS
ncbi:hypothetical protein D9M72_377300 [compost metagenome]